VRALNRVAAYVAAEHDRLGLERFGIPRRPCCVLLTPRFRRSHHVIALVLDERRAAPALVGKLPRHSRDVAGLAQEADGLRAVGPALADDSVPALLAFEDEPERPLLLESALDGSPLSPAAMRHDRRRSSVKAVVAWVERLGLQTAQMPEDDAWFERLVRKPLRSLAGPHPALRGLVELTLERSEGLLAAGLPLVFEHGDLRHPNLLIREDGRVGVVDWERAQPAGLPASDVFFFLAYAADAGRQGVLDPFFGRRPWAWELAEGYAERLGIDPRHLRPLLALSCARAVASGADLRRHVPLWRRALGDSWA
jgi:aminoglycoside phosphotransferase (APT) family kinase protein